VGGELAGGPTTTGSERPGTCRVSAKKIKVARADAGEKGVEDAVAEDAGEERLAVRRGRAGCGRCCNAL